MEDRIETIIKQLKTMIDFDLARRFFFLLGIAMSVAIGLGIYQWTQEPLYRPLDFQAHDKNYAAVIQALEDARIKYKLNDSNGLISVPASDINTARMKLSLAGLEKDEHANFSFLNDANKMGASQFLENARYLRALEEDLSKAVSSIQGINSAIVHIAKPQKNIFVGEQAKTTASIIIHIVPGYNSDEKVRAIIQLVAASVPELDPDNIAITDQYGHYLSQLRDASYTQSQEQLRFKNKLEHDYEKRIQALINPMLGANRAHVNVNIELDFTVQEEAKESFDPKQKIIRSQQSVKESNNASTASGVPGALSNQPPSNNQQGASNASGQKRSENLTNYEIGKSSSYIKSSTPSIKKMSVAVVLDDEALKDAKTGKNGNQPIAEEKLKQITELIKVSIGFNTQRGDQISVINSAFIHPDNELNDKPGFWQEPWFWDLFKKLLGISLGFAFLFVAYQKIAPEFMPRKVQEQLSGVEGISTQGMISSDLIKLKNEQLELLKQLVSDDPNKVIGVIKKWISK